MHQRLVFLPNGGFYYHSGQRAFWTAGLDPEVTFILKDPATNTARCKQVLALETIVQGTGKPSSFVSYYDDKDTKQIRCSFRHSHPKLANWLDEQKGDKTNVQISLGPNSQFFAQLGRKCFWSGVGGILDENIQKLADGKNGWKPHRTPERVLFGRNGSHLIACEDGRYLAVNSSFAAEYPKLHQTIGKHFSEALQTCRYKYITINPYVHDEWMIIWGDGTVEHNLPQTLINAFAGAAKWLQSGSMGNVSPDTSTTLSRRTSTSSASSAALVSAGRPLATSYPRAYNSRSPSFYTPTSRPSPASRPPYRPHAVPSVPSSLFAPTTMPSVPSSYFASPLASTSTPSSFFTSPMMTPRPLMPWWNMPQSNEMEMLHFFNNLNETLNGGGGYQSMFSGSNTGGYDAINNMFNGGGPMGLNSVALDPSPFMNLGMGMGMGMGLGC